MSANGQPGKDTGAGQVLYWTGRVLCAEDLRVHLNGQRGLIVSFGTVITPLAADQLRAAGIGVTRQPRDTASAKRQACWGVGQDSPYPVVAAALAALQRDGLKLQALGRLADKPESWARAMAEGVARGECTGGVVFCQNAGLIACVANKVAGVRAAAILSVPQAAIARHNLGANLAAVEMPGRTLFEIRQIVRTLCGQDPACPPGVACVLKELDGHAHR